ncbi:MAG: sigma-54-dependent Fis family transcriptional regulator [Deltaproteobacteria bacterium]|nr:sigma-54-dependent Fis family transcriptional regulator [Deltaproteobacteria bacterium]
MQRILIIDDEPLIRKSLKIALEEDGYDIYTAETGMKGIAVARTENIDIVFLDIKLPDIQGLDVLQKLKSLDSDLLVIMMTGYGTIESAVTAMKSGAFDYITKPFKTKDIATLIKLALETRSLKRDVKRFVDKDRTFYGLDKIVGQSAAIHDTIDMIKKIAQVDSSTVLIEGESGTGKELVAKAIHFSSSRCSRPFVEINCAAIPPSLLESELFGYEKGAFTDARKTKKGLIEQAHEGSLFLDEIGDMDAGMQAKILNVLQERKFRRLGGDKVIEVDVRIITATNHDLRKEVHEKIFREDLFYRINVIHIYLPPLRERTEDIPLLADSFIYEFNTLFTKHVRGIAPDALQVLTEYSWPGNVRELRNIIERIMILANPELIRREHIPAEILGLSGDQGTTGTVLSGTYREIPDGGLDIKEETERFQAHLIGMALEKARGHKARGAALLNVDRFALRYLMKKFNM